MWHPDWGTIHAKVFSFFFVRRDHYTAPGGLPAADNVNCLIGPARNLPISQFTLPPETITSCYPGIFHSEFRPYSGPSRDGSRPRSPCEGMIN